MPTILRNNYNCGRWPTGEFFRTGAGSDLIVRAPSRFHIQAHRVEHREQPQVHSPFPHLLHRVITFLECSTLFPERTSALDSCWGDANFPGNPELAPFARHVTTIMRNNYNLWNITTILRNNYKWWNITAIMRNNYKWWTITTILQNNYNLWNITTIGGT